MTEGLSAKGTADDVVRRLLLAEGAVASRKRKSSLALIFLLLLLLLGLALPCLRLASSLRAFSAFFLVVSISQAPGHFRLLSHPQTEEKATKEGDQVDQLRLVRFSWL